MAGLKVNENMGIVLLEKEKMPQRL